MKIKIDSLLKPKAPETANQNKVKIENEGVAPLSRAQLEGSKVGGTTMMSPTVQKMNKLTELTTHNLGLLSPIATPQKKGLKQEPGFPIASTVDVAPKASESGTRGGTEVKKENLFLILKSIKNLRIK